jgi:hypothetical protein
VTGVKDCEGCLPAGPPPGLQMSDVCDAKIAPFGRLADLPNHLRMTRNGRALPVPDKPESERWNLTSSLVDAARPKTLLEPADSTHLHCIGVVEAADAYYIVWPTCRRCPNRGKAP